MAEESAKQGFEAATGVLEAVGKGILIAYGIGFFIESYFDAKYGVTYLNPFRSRVAFTGIALLIQVGFVILVLNAETIWGVGSSYWYRSVRKSFGRARLRFKIPLIFAWIAETVTLGFAVRFIFAFHLQDHPELLPPVQQAPQATSPNAGWHILDHLHGMGPVLVAGISVFILLTIADALRRYRENRGIFKEIAAIAVVLCCICFLWSEAKIGDPVVIDFTIFVAMIRFAIMIYRADPRLERTELRLAMMGLVILLPTFYAERIYANILPQWGGAAKTRLWIRFEKEIVPFGLRSPAYLLEETEEGYYLLRPNDDPGSLDKTGISASSPEGNSSTIPLSQIRPPRSYSAIYVPRSVVTQVLYERSVNDSE
jgi:hypothetical protein